MEDRLALSMPGKRRSQKGSGLAVSLFDAGLGLRPLIMPPSPPAAGGNGGSNSCRALLHAVRQCLFWSLWILRVVYSVFGHELCETADGPFSPWVAAFTILVGVIVATRWMLQRRLWLYQQSLVSFRYISPKGLHPSSFGLAGAVLHMFGYSILKVSPVLGCVISVRQTGVN